MKKSYVWRDLYLNTFENAVLNKINIYLSEEGPRNFKLLKFTVILSKGGLKRINTTEICLLGYILVIEYFMWSLLRGIQFYDCWYKTCLLINLTTF